MAGTNIHAGLRCAAIRGRTASTFISTPGQRNIHVTESCVDSRRKPAIPMHSTQIYCRIRKARHLVIWCLLLALPVYGFSSTIVQLLGAVHTHSQVASSIDPMAGWVDYRRAPHAADFSVSHRESHSHSLFERHHHNANDETVLALDGPVTDTATSDVGSSSAGSAALVLALAGELRIDPAVASELEWTTAPADRIPSHVGARLERPPNLL